MNTVLCAACGGEGFFLYDGGPGRFCAYTGNWLPFEIRVPCGCCHATGFIEQDEDDFNPEPLLIDTTLDDDVELPF